MVPPPQSHHYKVTLTNLNLIESVYCKLTINFLRVRKVFKLQNSLPAKLFQPRQANITHTNESWKWFCHNVVLSAKHTTLRSRSGFTELYNSTTCINRISTITIFGWYNVGKTLSLCNHCLKSLQISPNLKIQVKLWPSLWSWTNNLGIMALNADLHYNDRPVANFSVIMSLNFDRFYNDRQFD